MYLSIEADVLTVDVAKDIGMKERMIQGGVKDNLFVGPSARDLYLVQTFIPGRPGPRAHSIEIPHGILLL